MGWRRRLRQIERLLPIMVADDEPLSSVQPVEDRANVLGVGAVGEIATRRADLKFLTPKPGSRAHHGSR